MNATQTTTPSTQITPKVTMYANRYGYTDIEPYEVVRYISAKVAEIRPMTATLDPTWKAEWVAGGYAGVCTNQGTQRWIIESNPDAGTIEVRQNKKGQWVRRGVDQSGDVFKIEAQARKFHDYNF